VADQRPDIRQRGGGFDQPSVRCSIREDSTGLDGARALPRRGARCRRHRSRSDAAHVHRRNAEPRTCESRQVASPGDVPTRVTSNCDDVRSRSAARTLLIDEPVKADQWRSRPWSILKADREQQWARTAASVSACPRRSVPFGVRLIHKYRRRSAAAASLVRLRLKGDTKRPALSIR
jgi:hypothetical protein